MLPNLCNQSSRGRAFGELLQLIVKGTKVGAGRLFLKYETDNVSHEEPLKIP